MLSGDYFKIKMEIHFQFSLKPTKKKKKNTLGRNVFFFFKERESEG